MIVCPGIPFWLLGVTETPQKRTPVPLLVQRATRQKTIPKARNHYTTGFVSAASCRFQARKGHFLIWTGPALVAPWEQGFKRTSQLVASSFGLKPKPPAGTSRNPGDSTVGRCSGSRTTSWMKTFAGLACRLPRAQLRYELEPPVSNKAALAYPEESKATSVPWKIWVLEIAPGKAWDPNTLKQLGSPVAPTQPARTHMWPPKEPHLAGTIRARPFPAAN